MAFQPLQTFQIIAPIPMPISASSYTEAVKNYVKMHRNASIDQLIIEDQINNNRMLASIKYYKANNKNKFRANLVPTTLTTLQNGGMFPMVQAVPMVPMIPMGRGPTNVPFVGPPPFMGGPNPMMGGPMMGGPVMTGPVMRSSFMGPPILANPMMVGRVPNPFGPQASSGTTFAAGTTISNTTELGANVELPSGTVLPVGSVIDPADNFPQGFILPFGTNIPGGIVWPPGANLANPNITIAINIGPGGGGVIPVAGGGFVNLPPNCNIPAGACFPAGTFISVNTVLTCTTPLPAVQTNNDVSLPSGTVIPRGTIFNNSFLPQGTVIIKGTVIPRTTVLVNATIPNGSNINLTNYPVGNVINTPTNTIPNVPQGSIFNLAAGFQITGCTFPSGLVIQPPTYQPTGVFMPAPIITGVAPIFNPFPRRHRSRHH